MSNFELDLRPQLECNRALLLILRDKINAAHDHLTPPEFSRILDCVDAALFINTKLSDEMPMQFTVSRV